jgi:hypothetical protein
VGRKPILAPGRNGSGSKLRGVLTLALTISLSLSSGTLAGPPRAANFLGADPEPQKSTNLLLAGGELVLGLVGGYVFLLGGIAANIGNGGVSLPPDLNDIILVGLVPALGAAGFAWLIGLLDLSQRSLLGSLVLSGLGGAVGELVGLVIGVLVGQSLYPADQAAAALLAIFLAPAVAAVGAMLSMELFKGGDKSGGFATLTITRTRDGRGIAAGPALGWVF